MASLTQQVSNVSRRTWQLIGVGLLTLLLLFAMFGSSGDDNSDSYYKTNFNSFGTSLGSTRSILETGSDTLSNIYASSDYLYAVVVDAGSTGSRVHVYKYKNSADSSSELLEIDFQNEQYQKFKPGLSSFEDKATDAAAMQAYLEPLLEFARQQVPFQYRPMTPFYVLATAGLRKVREKSETTAANIIKTCFDYLETSEFLIYKNYVRIIEGKDEGLWGWITANYLNGAIPEAIRSQDDPTKVETKGVLEMGGESLQITFLLDASSNSKTKTLADENESATGSGSESFVNVEIGNVNFFIFTHSYMGVGMEAAQGAFDNYLVKADERSNSVCYIRGDARERQSGQKVVWQGAGDFGECYGKLTDMMTNYQDQQSCQNSNTLKSKLDAIIKDVQLQCSLNGVVMPRIDSGALAAKQEFYYIENFFYTSQVLGIQDVSGADGAFYESLKETGEKYCKLTKDEAIKAYPDASDDEIAKTCFGTAWIAVIIDAGFELNQFFNFNVVRDINGVGIDWALGFLVQKSGEIAKAVQKKIKNEGSEEASGLYGMAKDNKLFTALVIIVALGLCYTGFAMYYSKTRNGEPNPIQRLWYKVKRTTNTGKTRQSNKVAYSKLSTFSA